MRERWTSLLRDPRGLTMVELLVALVMLAVIFGGMFASTRAMAQSWALGQHRVGVQQMGRASLDWMVRRIRLAGQGYERQRVSVPCLPFYRFAEPSRLVFLADVTPGDGVCGPFEELEYRVTGGRLVERVRSSTGATSRDLTVNEEVGVITVTDLNFCYYDVFDRLIADQSVSLADGQETCSGNVRSDRLGDVYRVKIRLRVVSGRPGEAPFDVASQAVRRLEVLP